MPLTESPQPIDLHLFQAIPGTIALLLPDSPVFTIAAVTDDYCTTSGKSRAELVGRGLFDAFPNRPDDEDQASEKGLRASLEHVLARRELHRLPLHRYDIPRADGTFEERYWSAVNKPVTDESGTVRYIIHTAEDLTHQIKAEQDANRIQSLEHSYNLFMQAPVTIGIVRGPEFIIELANDSLLEVWGRSAAVIGTPLFEAIPELKGQGFRELLEQVRSTGVPYYAYEHPIRLNRHGKEEVTYFDFVYKPYYEEGQSSPVGVLAVGHDITKQVEERQKFKNVMQQAKDPILILMGEDLVLDVANQALFDLWQVGPEAINKPFVEILPEMKNQGFVDLLKNVLHTGKPFFGNEVPATFQRRNGEQETVYFDFSYQPFRMADESIGGVLVIAKDVTEQVLARQKLVKSEQNLRSTILQSPVAMCILKEPFYVVEVANERMFELWGKTPEEMLGRPLFEGLPEARNQGFEEELLNVYTTGNAFRANERPVELPRDGKLETAYINFVYEPFRDGDGSISGIIAVAIDVTEQVLARKKVEEAQAETDRQKRLYEAITGSTPDLMYVFDLSYRFTYANEALLTMWGKQREDAVGKRLLDNGYEPWHAEMHEQEIGEVVATKRPVRGEVSFPHAELGRRIYDYILVPIINEAGDVEAVAGTTRDITEIKQAEEVLRQSQERLEALVSERTQELQRSNKELEEFAYAASHDMKEPIRKIHFFADRLKAQLQEQLNEEQKRSFERLELASKRMGTLIDDLLEYSQATKGLPHVEEVDLNKKVQLVLEDLELESEQKGAQITVDHLPVVKGNKRQMQQLFHNLLSNALKYCKADTSPEVHIGCREVMGDHIPVLLSEDQRNRKYYLIEVRDNGIGFPQEDARRIFNVFTRLHGNAEYRGTGVGLSIAQRVVQNHDGHIWAESEPGKGSRFKILLPV